MSLKIQNYYDGNVKLIEINKFQDSRGHFSEIYNKKNFKKFGIIDNFVQDNYSFSKNKNTLRGLHFQSVPQNQSKIIKVLKGSIFDVVIDIKFDSPTFGKYQSFNLSDKNSNQLYISDHFAHGFCTLEENTEVLYKTSKYYSPNNEKTIIWDDIKLSINWPLDNNRIISSKDLKGQSFVELTSFFKKF